MNCGSDNENTQIKNEEMAIKKKVFDVIENTKKENVEKESAKKKLYLNTTKDNNVIKILYNILTTNVMAPIIRAKQLCDSKFMKFWTKDSTTSIKELMKFVIIHGALGATVLTCGLVITNSDLILIQTIRGSMVLTGSVLLFGTGSGYYLFEDVLKIIKENRSK